jgi:hypothetical protein
MKKIILYAVLCFAVVLVVFAACSKSSNSPTASSDQTVPSAFPTTTPVTSPNLTGVLRIPQVKDKNINGKQYIVVVDNDANSLNGTTVPGGFIVGTVNKAIEGLGAQYISNYRKVTYMAAVADGPYYIYSFIDADGNGAISGGDFTSSIYSLTVAGNTVQDILLFPAPCTVKVRLNLPRLAMGMQYVVGMYSLSNNIEKYRPWYSEPDFYFVDNVPLSMSFDAATFVVDPNSYPIQYRLIAEIMPSFDESGTTVVEGDMFGAYNVTDFNTLLTAANITIDRDMEVAINMTDIKNNVKGTMTLPAAADGNNYIISVSTGPLNTGYPEIVTTSGTCGTGTSIAYEMFVLFSDTVFITGQVDNNGNAGGMINPDSGDFAGLCGYTVTNWTNPYPASTNTAVPGTGKNITLQTVPAP